MVEEKLNVDKKIRHRIYEIEYLDNQGVGT